MQSTGSGPTKQKFRYRAKAKSVCIFLVIVGALLQLHPNRSLNSCQRSLQGANVAVLMYGQARTLNRTHCSITEHILTPLLLASHKVHVFVHGELDGDSWQYHAYLDQLSKKRDSISNRDTVFTYVSSMESAMSIDDFARSQCT